jgi:murein DD-endopeptidase MepM/ murein hydrolase activator NlpD
MTRAIAVITGMVALLLTATTGAATLVTQTPVAGGAFVKPVTGASISQGFGCTRVSIEPADAACPGGHWHSGIDLAAAAGTPVVATAPGVAHVIFAATGFGLHVVLDHGGGLQSLYGHLSAVDVVDGQPVSGGQLIGAVGSTGNSSGPHLHFEIDRNGIAEDPRGLVALP